MNQQFNTGPGARVALYARYSSALQKETSIEDQLRAARALAQREGWVVVKQFQDEEVKGYVPLLQRPGSAALVEAAINREFDILIMEGLDRFSRTSSESDRWARKIQFYGIAVITTDGYDCRRAGSTVQRLANGMKNEVFLEDLSNKTHRGLAGQFDRGNHVGGTCYGYRSIPKADGRGNTLVIDEKESAVVLRIFAMFADGHSHRAIAHQLNAEKIPSPRGSTWAPSALYGDTKRAAGMLNNELYVGIQTWNRRQWLRDPEEGKRRPIMRSRDEWQVRKDESLRIIPQELWDRVRSRERSGVPAGTRSGKGAAPKTLLSGLLRCATCGGPIVAIDRYRYGCNLHADRGPTVCESPARVGRRAIEEQLLVEVRAELQTPEAIAEMKDIAKQIAQEMQRASRDGSAHSEKRLQTLQREVANLIDAIAMTGITSTLAERLRASEIELAELRAEKSRAERVDRTPDQFADELVRRYAELVRDLDQVIGQESNRARARTILADLLGPVTIGMDPDGRIWAEMEKPAGRLLDTIGGSTGLVARARFELATFGL